MATLVLTPESLDHSRGERLKGKRDKHKKAPFESVRVHVQCVALLTVCVSFDLDVRTMIFHCIHLLYRQQSASRSKFLVHFSYLTCHDELHAVATPSCVCALVSTVNTDFFFLLAQSAFVDQHQVVVS